jgi:hypothetical protein
VITEVSFILCLFRNALLPILGFDKRVLASLHFLKPEFLRILKDSDPLLVFLIIWKT